MSNEDLRKQASELLPAHITPKMMRRPRTRINHLMMLLCLTAATTRATTSSAQTVSGDTSFHPVQVLNASQVGEVIGRLYPARLHEMEISGYAVLRVLVGADAQIKERAIFISSGVRAFDRSALRVTDSLKLRPAMHNGVPVASRTLIPITFQGKPKKGVVHYKQARALNRDSVRIAGMAQIPVELRNASISTYAALTLDINKAGSVTKAMLNQSSCFRKADDVALDLGRMLRFMPNSGADVEKGQVNITVSFQSDSVYVRVAGDTLLSDTVPKNPSAPVYTKKPDLKNRAAIAKDLTKAYPTNYQEGPPIEALVWLLVDEEGKVARRQIEDTSGNCLVDVAILDVLKAARFDPALDGNKPVPVWIQLPIILKTE